MNNAVLISINPEWCDLIRSGQKTLEIRKNRPRMPTPFKCYIYQTGEYVSAYEDSPWAGKYMPGAIIGEFAIPSTDSQSRIPPISERSVRASRISLRKPACPCSGRTITSDTGMDMRGTSPI